MFEKILLLLSILFSFPKPPSDGKEINYVSLGASQTTGFGLHGFVPDEMYEDPHVVYNNGNLSRDGYYSSGINYYSDLSYPVLIKKELEKRYDTVNFKQLGINSLRAYDLAYLLDSTMPKDKYINWRLGDESKGWINDLNRERHDVLEVNGMTYHYDKEETNFREILKDAIEKADLISYDLGCNDMFIYFSQMITSYINNPAKPKFSNDLTALLGEKADKYFEVKEFLLNKILGGLFGLEDSITDTVSYVLDSLVYAVSGYIIGFEKAMDTIYELNPDVKVVVVSVQNLLKDTKLTVDGMSFDMGIVGSVLAGIPNLYSHFISKYSNKYYFADLRDRNVQTFRDEIASWDGDVEHLSQSFMDAMNAYESSFLASYDIKKYINDNLEDFVTYYNEIPGNSSLANTVEEKEQLANSLASRAVKIIFATFAQAFSSAFKNAVGDFNYTNEEIIEDYVKIALSDDGSTFKAILENMVNGVGDSVLLENTVNKVNDYLAQPGYFSRTVFLGLSYGNSYFSHPNVEGHKEMARAILEAYDNKVVARETLSSGEQKIADALTNIATSIFMKDYDKIADIIGNIDLPIFNKLSESLRKVQRLIDTLRTFKTVLGFLSSSWTDSGIFSIISKLDF